MPESGKNIPHFFWQVALLCGCQMPFFSNGSILFSINSFLEVLPLEICGLCSFCFFRIAKSSINSSYRSFSSFIFCSNSRSEGWKQRRETLIHFMPFLTINDASLSLFLAILFIYLQFSSSASFGFIWYLRKNVWKVIMAKLCARCSGVPKIISNTTWRQ